MRVRPIVEPVPREIRDSPLGEIFGRFVRTTDGGRRDDSKHVLTDVLARVPRDTVATQTRRHAVTLLAARSIGERGAVATYVYALAPLVLASTLGLRTDAGVANLTRDVVRAIAAGASPDAVARGIRASGVLHAAISSDAGCDGTIFATLVREARARDVDRVTIDADTIGLLVQCYDATAALMANAFVATVAREDAPIANTRRHAAEAATLAGAGIVAGDAVLVVLAAGHPFGIGAHRCPGAHVATTIASAGLRALLASGFDARPYATPTYRPSPNVRMPDFHSGTRAEPHVSFATLAIHDAARSGAG